MMASPSIPLFPTQQVQTGYNYDLCLHSVMPVSAEDAKANLQPVPGQIEYAPGCVARQYKLHTLLNTKSGKEYQQWFGYNLAVTEDLNPMRAFHTISDCIAHVDCEDYAGNNIALANSIMNVKQFLSTSKQATLEDVMHSRIHDFSVVSAAGDAVRTAPAPPSTQEELQVGVLQSLHHLLGQVRDLKVESVMGMAHGGQAGAADQSLTGHAYSLITCKLSDGKDYINIIEGTKWVQADDAGATNRVCRNAGLPTPVLQTLDQVLCGIHAGSVFPTTTTRLTRCMSRSRSCAPRAPSWTRPACLERPFPRRQRRQQHWQQQTRRTTRPGGCWRSTPTRLLHQRPFDTVHSPRR